MSRQLEPCCILFVSIQMSEFRNVYVNYKGPSHYENMWAICNRGISIQFTVSFFHFSWAMPKTIACQILNRQERHIDNIFCLLSFEKSELSNNQSIIDSLKVNWMFDMKLISYNFDYQDSFLQTSNTIYFIHQDLCIRWLSDRDNQLMSIMKRCVFLLGDYTR